MTTKPAPALSECPLTRTEAIELARLCAYQSKERHSYLPDSLHPGTWMPHEWVIDAMMRAAESKRTPPAVGGAVDVAKPVAGDMYEGQQWVTVDADELHGLRTQHDRYASAMAVVSEVERKLFDNGDKELASRLRFSEAKFHGF